MFLGNYFRFVWIDPGNVYHQKALSSIATSGGEFLGNVESYQFSKNENTVDGNDFLVIDQTKIIGYISLSKGVETPLGATSSLYYAVIEGEYGKNYGALMIKDICYLLKKFSDIQLLIANVEKINKYSLRVMDKSKFNKFAEFEDDIQFHFHV